MKHDETQITEAIKSAKHSLALEGLKVTNEEENAIRSILQGKFSIHDLVRKIKAENV